MVLFHRYIDRMDTGTGESFCWAILDMSFSAMSMVVTDIHNAILMTLSHTEEVI